jgi:hypothetical protein
MDREVAFSVTDRLRDKAYVVYHAAKAHELPAILVEFREGLAGEGR